MTARAHETIERMLASDNVNMVRCAVRHPLAPSNVLERLARHHVAAIRVEAAANEKLTDAQFLELLSDPSDEVRKSALSTPRCPLVSGMAASVIQRYGLEPSIFMNEHSPKRLTREIIGSKHPAEIDFLFSRDDLGSLPAISTLQEFFTIQTPNGNNKLDRHGYLEFLAESNKKGVDGRCFAVPGPVFRTVADHMGLDAVIAIAASQSTIGARDTLSMISETLQRETEAEATHHLQLIKRWLASNEQDYGKSFHDYLTNKANREHKAAGKLKREPASTEFAQVKWLEKVPAINDALKEKGLEIHLPKNRYELRELGSQLRHCVGGKHYADRCVRGLDTIFNLQPIGKPKRGVTCQFCNETGRSCQIRGDRNRCSTSEEREIAEWVYAELTA